MTHIAIQEKLEGKVVEWMEHVLMSNTANRLRVNPASSSGLQFGSLEFWTAGNGESIPQFDAYSLARGSAAQRE